MVKRLLECKDLVADAAKEFEDKLNKQQLHSILSFRPTKKTKNDKVLNGKVSINEMKNVYTEKFVPESSPGRILYNKLLLAPTHGRCPFCCVGLADSLDHHLPKANYPYLAVVPINLVPMCSICNKIKTASAPTTPEEHPLHPYFDHISSESWLDAELLTATSPVSVKFYVNPPDGWTAVLKSRVKNHFKSLHLNRIFSSNSANEMAGIKNILEMNFISGGAARVSEFLSNQAFSWTKVNLNCWQAVLYSTLANSHWYCNGGFR